MYGRLLEQLTKPNISVEVKPNSENQTTETKEIPTAENLSNVLGLKWNHSTDAFVVGRRTSPNTDANVFQRVLLSRCVIYDQSALAFKNHWRLTGQQWDE